MLNISLLKNLISNRKKIAAKLKHVKLVSKTNFDSKLIALLEKLP